MRTGICRAGLIEDAFNLINRQKAEIERLTDSNRRLRDDMRMMLNNDNGSDQIRAEAIKEFWGKLRAYMNNITIEVSGYSKAKTFVSYGDNLLKKMTEGKDDG